MRAVCYARVSSVAQRERDTIASQLAVLPAFVASQGWTLARPVGTYVDDGHSAKAGKLEQRAGLSALLRDAAAHVFEVVVVVDVDRLTRSEDLTERGAILGAFQRAGVKIASATSGQVLDLSTTSGDLFSTLYAFFAAEENRKRGERSTRGKLATAGRGGKIGGLTPYGLAYDRQARAWSLHPERAAVVRELFDRVAAGESCWSLAEDLNRRGVPFHGGKGTWGRGQVWALIKSRHPVGEYVAHRRTRTIVAVPAIVDEETWQAAQAALMAGRKAALRKTKHVYLLEGLARCGACGGRMMVRSAVLDKRRFPVPARYVCERRKYPDHGPRCSAPFVSVADADARAWSAILREMRDPALPAELAADRGARAADARDWSADAEGYRAHLARLDKVRDAHLARFRRGLLSDDELDQELAAVRRERAAVAAQLRFAESARGSVATAQARLLEATGALDAMLAAAAEATPEERRGLVLAVVDPGGIVCHGQDLHVELWIERPAASLVTAARSVGEHESFLRIRTVG
jgi:site-specific DNA recombinase